MSSEVERVEFAGPTGLVGELWRREEPLVIEGGVGEDVRARWTAESVVASAGGREVTLVSSDEGRLDYAEDGRRNYVTERVTLAEATRRVRGVEPPAACYVRQTALEGLGLEAAGHPAELLVAPDARGFERNLWLGSAGAVSPLHYDGKNNLLCQMHGRKRVTLLPPTEHAGAYPYGLSFRPAHVSRVDPENVDRDRFPDFPSESARVAELAPGDTLYVPALWWHHVRSLDASVSVNVWWRARPRQFLCANAADYLRLKYRQGRLAKLYAGAPEAERASCLAGLAAEAAALGFNLHAALFAGAAAHALAQADPEGAGRDADLSRWLSLADLAASGGRAPANPDLESLIVRLSERS